jgi:aryl-alcohol dehydrogenase-like predicted oxidoreductase
MEPYAGDAAARRLAVLDAVAAETGCQPGQVMLAWMAAQRSPGVLPLIGTTRVTRYREAAQALNLELTAEQLTALDAA